MFDPDRVLASVLDRHEMSQTALAERLGVSRQVVSSWVGGREQLPGTRAEEVVAILNLDANLAEALIGVAADPFLRAAAEPQTFLAWLVTWDPTGEHLGASYTARATRLAYLCDTTVGEVGRWLSGKRLIPVAAARALCDPETGAWRNLDPALFSVAGELGTEVDEREAVEQAVAEVWLGDSEAYESWDSLFGFLEAQEAAWRENPMALADLAFDSCKVPSFYLEMAESFR